MDNGVSTQRPPFLEGDSRGGVLVRELRFGLAGASDMNSQIDWRRAWRNFLIKIAIYWLAELVICQINDSRFICSVIAKGFWPCLATFALMDFLVLPKIRQLLTSRRQGREL